MSSLLKINMYLFRAMMVALSVFILSIVVQYASAEVDTGKILVEGSDGVDNFVISSPGGAGIPSVAVPTPTMNEWGMMIFMLLAGLWGIYYIRRLRGDEK